MMEENELLDRFAALQRETLRLWVERGWVAPLPAKSGFRYREVDVARVGLIYEFSTELALDEDTVEVILPLIDQVHGLRHQLRRLADAIATQPDDVRRQIAEALAKPAE